MDGISLLPLAKNPSTARTATSSSRAPTSATYGIRRGPWKYNLWNNGDEELYNLDDDPYELTNLLYDGPVPVGPLTHGRRDGKPAQAAAGAAQDLQRRRPASSYAGEASSSFCFIASARAWIPLIGRT